MSQDIKEAVFREKPPLLVNNYLDIFQELISSCNHHPLHNEVLGLSKNDYFSFVDSKTILQDAQQAINSYKKYGIRVNPDQNDDGELFLRFYGLMNACYLQREAIVTCYDKLGIDKKSTNLENLKIAQIIGCRNKFASHSPHYDYSHSYIPSKVDLDNGIIVGNSLNSPNGSVTFGPIELSNMLDNWEYLLQKSLESILDETFRRLCDPTSFKEIKDKYQLLKNLN